MSGRGAPGPCWVRRKHLGLAQRVEGALGHEPTPSLSQGTHCFFLQEAGSTCSSSVSDVISDPEELLLESLPSSEDEPPSCPSGTFFLFFIFFFLPSFTLFTGREGQQDLGPAWMATSCLTEECRKALKTRGEGGEPGPQDTTPGLQERFGPA